MLIEVISFSRNENGMTIRIQTPIRRIRNLYSMYDVEYTSSVRIIWNHECSEKCQLLEGGLFKFYIISVLKICNNTQTVIDDSNLYTWSSSSVCPRNGHHQIYTSKWL